MTANKYPDWLRQVPLKTVGVLCATHIFGKNIESRQIALAGKRYFHNAVENVVGYILNPILPDLHIPTETDHGDASMALRHIRDCFNFIFHIQVEYFKILKKMLPERFHSRRTGAEFNLNQFMAKGPTLINSEKRYLILSKIDGAQPFDLNLNWNAEFDWVTDDIRRRFHSRLVRAQDAYADALDLGAWYSDRDKNLVMPLKTIMDDLSEFFDHLGLAAYLMARKSGRGDADVTALIRENLEETCRHLERFTVDMLRVNVFSITMHDRDRLGGGNIERVIRARAGDDSYVGHYGYPSRYEEYSETLRELYAEIGFRPAAKAG